MCIEACQCVELGASLFVLFFFFFFFVAVTTAGAVFFVCGNPQTVCLSPHPTSSTTRPSLANHRVLSSFNPSPKTGDEVKKVTGFGGTTYEISV